MLGTLVFPVHLVHDVVQGAAGAQPLVVLSAILTTIHLGLVLRGDRLGVVVTLERDTDHRHMVIHQAVIAAQVAPPEVATQGILSDRLFTGFGHQVSWIAIGAVPHVECSLQEFGARLRRIPEANTG